MLPLNSISAASKLEVYNTPFPFYLCKCMRYQHTPNIPKNWAIVKIEINFSLKVEVCKRTSHTCGHFPEKKMNWLDINVLLWHFFSWRLKHIVWVHQYELRCIFCWGGMYGETAKATETPSIHKSDLNWMDSDGKLWNEMEKADFLHTFHYLTFYKHI